jgi:hypothetical protein
MTLQTRLWLHDGLWRIQSLRQLPDRHGTLQDAWESWCENGCVLFFVSEEQARAYLDEATKRK